ncbi:hypothetical protein ABPG77_011129 [Micractinium sp. CCAP 211/92]
MAEEEGREQGDGEALQAALRQPEPSGQAPDLFCLLSATTHLSAASACGLNPGLAAFYRELLDRLPAEQRAAKEGRLRKLLQQSLHGTVQQVMAGNVMPGSHVPPSSAARLQSPAVAVQTAAAEVVELPILQPLRAQRALPGSSSAAGDGQPTQQDHVSGAQRKPEQAQQVEQASAEPQQAEQAQQAQQANQAPAEPQQDLFFALMHAARSPAGTAAGLTPELAASFMMLMDRLPPGERAGKETQLRALLGWGLHGAAAQAMTTALHFGVPAAGGAP